MLSLLKDGDLKSINYNTFENALQEKYMKANKKHGLCIFYKNRVFKSINRYASYFSAIANLAQTVRRSAALARSSQDGKVGAIRSILS